jgi:N-acylneuraminate cytidylyltransferase
MKSSAVAIITARGGSKRIPRKNIREFCGKPVIAYSIEAALSSECFDLVIVSTDDQEIAEISRSFGADVPFMRSKCTSDDYSTTAEVMLEVLSKLNQLKQGFELACCIYPTAPFITADLLRRGYALLEDDPHADGVLPVTKFSYPIQRALRVGRRSGFTSFVHPEHTFSRSQDLETMYHDVGQFYWLRVERFLESKSLIGESTLALKQPEWSAQDIDTDEDWELAEMKFRMVHIRDQDG